MSSAALARIRPALADRYRIERELGEGGMATVYLARDVKHDREVALKVLRPELAAILGRERFLNEIRLTAKLDHPHIVTLIDSGETNGLLWYVLPFIRGESLRERLHRERQLGVDEALAIAKQIASALDYAHRQGVIHRDLKPENILLHEGEAMLADFGIALALKEAGGSRLTETGLSLGTPQYMSPEQATGDRVLDARSDVYSLGAVLYEMLAGEPPHTGATVQAVIAKLMTERPTRLRTVRDTVPEGVDAAVAKALAKVPADRFSGAKEFAAMLTADPVAMSGNSRKRRLVWAGAALTGAVLSTGAIVLTLNSRRQPGAPTPAGVRTQLTYTGRATSPTLSPDGAYVAYLERRECPEQADCPSEVVVQETAANGSRRIVGSVGFGWIGAWSPDSRRFLVAEVLGNSVKVNVISLLGEMVGFSLGQPATWAAPDTLLTWDLTSVHDAKIWIRTVRAAGSATSDSFAFGPTSGVDQVEVSPNARWIVVAHRRAGYWTGPSLVIVSRRGVVSDSMPAFDSVVGWGRRSDRIYVTRRRGDRTELLRQGIDPGTGRRSGTPVRVVALSSGSVSVQGSLLAYAEMGPARNELWALQRSAGPSGQFTTRRIFQTTARGGTWLSRDGNRVYVTLREQREDTSTTRRYVMPFGGGPLVPFGSPRTWNAMAGSLSPREDQAIIAERRNGETRLSVVDFQTGAGRDIGRAPSDSGWVWWLGNGRFLWQPRTGREFVVMNDQGAVERRFSWPDSLGSSGADPSPDGAALSILSTKIAGAKAENILYRFSLIDGTVRPLARNLPLSTGWGGGWTSDDWIHLIVSNPVGGKHLVRVSARDGRMMDDGPLPVAGDAVHIIFSEDGRRAVEWVTNHTSDIVLLRDFDLQQDE